MGIFCEINLSSDDGTYTFQAGSTISGTIRYSLEKAYDFSAITVSLKGRGELYFEDLVAKRRDRMYEHFSDEEYVDIDQIIYSNDTGPLAAGQYEAKFNFELPLEIPPSLSYSKDTIDFYVECKIKYYLRIKFERPGLFNINKHFKKKIHVIPGQTPLLSTEPLIYGDQKTLIQLSSLFSKKKSIVNLKATVVKSVLRPGELVEVDYEVENDTKVDIKCVKVNLIETDKFETDFGPEEEVSSKVDGTAFEYDTIAAGDTANFRAIIEIPEACASIDHSKMIARKYTVKTVVVLPLPHTNLPLEIPVQIIPAMWSGVEEDVNGVDACFGVGIAMAGLNGNTVDAPPTYWEAMGMDDMKSVNRKQEDIEEKQSISSTSS